MKALTFGSLFAGILGFDYGFVQAGGMRPLWLAENDSKCSTLIAERAPGIPNLGDVRNVKKETVAAVDVVVGGFPCQDLSVAGKRAGLAGERSGLWFEFHRVLAELRPRWAVIENVPGLLSSNGGRDLAIILQGLAQIGYCTAWRILDAQYYGVAQRRRRVFIVASLGNGRCAEVLFERESLSWDTAPSRETGEGVAETFTIRAGKPSGGKGYLGCEDRAMTLGSQQQWLHCVANSLTSHPGRNSGEDNFVPVVMEIHGGSKRKDRPEGGFYVRKMPTTKPLDTSGLNPNCAQGGVLAFAWQQGVSENDRSYPVRKGDHAGSLSRTRVDAVSGSFGVRRLTPTECERLQGFPDGWTDNGQSDSVRYRQLGNAVCTRHSEWIGRQIIKAEVMK